MNTSLSQLFNSVLLNEEIENFQLESNGPFYYANSKKDFYVYQKSLTFKNNNNKSLNFNQEIFIIEKSKKTPIKIKQFKNYFKPYINFNKFNNNDYDFIKKFIYLLLKGSSSPFKNFKILSDNNLDPDNYFNYYLFFDNKSEFFNISEQLFFINNQFNPLIRYNIAYREKNSIIVFLKYESKLYFKSFDNGSSLIFNELDNCCIESYYQFFKNKPINLDSDYITEEEIKKIELKNLIIY